MTDFEKVKTYDIDKAAVSAVTGLSEKSLNRLISINGRKPNVIAALNLLIETDALSRLVEQLLIAGKSIDSDHSPKSSKPSKHKYGEYGNVMLTDDELDKLKTEYPDWADRIERLSSYIASSGKSYKSHYATIRNWARKDVEKNGQVERPDNGVADNIGTWL